MVPSTNSARRFLGYLKAYIPLILLAGFCVLIIAIGELGYVHILADTIDALKLIEVHDFDQKPLTVYYFQLKSPVLIGADGESSNPFLSWFGGYTFELSNKKQALHLVVKILVWIFGLVLLKGSFAYLSDFLMRLVGLKMIIRFRNELYQKMVLAPLGTVSEYRSGDLLSRLTDDVRSLQATVGSTASVIRASIYVPVFITVMLLRNFRLTILALLVLPPLGYLINRFGQRIRRTSRDVQKRTADLSSQVKETLNSLPIIKCFGAEGKEIERFADTTTRQYRPAMKRIRLSAMLPPLIEVVSVIGISTVFGLGCWQVIQGNLTTGWFIGYISMISLMFKPLRTIGQFNTIFQQSVASAERIFQVLDFPSERDGNVPLKSPSGGGLKSGEVVFDNVSFGYNQEELVLHDINLKAEAGQTIALVGISGSGKTSLVNLIPRFYNPSRGRILIDGQDISNLQLRSLRQEIAVVTQSPILFDGTIMENVAYGRSTATEQEIIAACTVANADGFIREFSKGYQSTISENGQNLSGGEKQRLAIARAILKNSRILLLDEATSSLDSESETSIQSALSELMGQRTTFVIAHRLSTIVNADQILVVDKGRIIERGQHSELLQKKGQYAQLHRMSPNNISDWPE
ncbi:MAG: ABC transporter ATP-binding protein [Candidatus Poribacteria bacterium]|nr:ABC transporter ATP-binding protein [Candidatus Poribacteria bacterium]